MSHPIRRIVLGGYYGFNNLGDDLLLQVIIKELHKRFPLAHITVLSQNPTQTKQLHSVQARNRLNPFSIFLELVRADLFVLGGGGLLQDHTSSRSLMYYLSLVSLADWFGCRVFYYALGVESIKNEKNRKRIQRVVGKNSICVRDVSSKEQLVVCGVPQNQIHVTADPVFLLDSNGIKKETPPSSVVFCPRFPCPKEGKKAYRELIRIVREQKSPVKGLLLQPLKEKQQACLEVPDIPFLEGSLDDFHNVLAIINSSSLVVSARFHALVLAALNHIPFIGVGDPYKVGRFCEAWGWPFLPWSANPDQIQAALERVRKDQQPRDQLLEHWKSNAALTAGLL